MDNDVNIYIKLILIHKKKYKFIVKEKRMEEKRKNNSNHIADEKLNTENKIIIPIIPYERKLEIENFANEILNEAQVEDGQVFDLISHLQKENFVVIDCPLGDDTTGMLIVDENKSLNILGTNTNKLIVINEHLKYDDNYLKRRRFICAHEYGHYQLHKNGKLQLAMRDTGHFGTLEEQEAEYFARCLLMPQDKVIKLISIVNRISQEKSFYIYTKCVSDFFNVTIKKATQRLRELGYIEG